MGFPPFILKQEGVSVSLILPIKSSKHLYHLQFKIHLHQSRGHLLADPLSHSALKSTIMFQYICIVLLFIASSNNLNVAKAQVQDYMKEKKVRAPLSQIEVNVHYVWSAPNTDLDTRTSFLGDQVGFDCARPAASDRYMDFGTDVQSVGGTETVKIKVGDAFNDGNDPTLGAIVMGAGWFDFFGTTATIRVTVRNTVSNQNLSTFTVPITPVDDVSGCLDDDRYFVAQMFIRQLDGEVSFTLTTKNTNIPPTDQSIASNIAGCSGDPHCSSFDGLKFDCQGTGEFLLSRIIAPSIDLIIQGRLGQRSGAVTFGKGFSILEKNGLSPRVQVSIRENPSTPSTTIAGCPIVFYVGDTAEELVDGKTYSSGIISVSRLSNTYTVSLNLFGTNGVSASFTPTRTGTSCILLSMNFQVPKFLFFGTGSSIGLFGSSDENPNNDWVTPGGVVLDPPTNREERRFKKSYDYCTQNWCVRTAEDSIFKYEAGSSFEDFFECDLPYPGTTQIDDPPVALNEICNGNEECLIEGIALNPTAAKQLVQANMATEQLRKSTSELLFAPDVIQAFLPTDIQIILDLSERTDPELATVSSFAVFTVNSDTRATTSFLGNIVDDGSAINFDDVPNDKIYSNKFQLFAFSAETTFSFKFVPIINGVRVQTSPLVRFALESVTAVDA